MKQLSRAAHSFLNDSGYIASRDRWFVRLSHFLFYLSSLLLELLP